MSVIQITEEIVIAAPADEAWSIVSDYDRDVDWRGGVISMVPEPPGPARVGTITHEQMRLAGRSWHNVGVVTAVEPGHHLRWRTTAGARAHGARTVLPLDESRCRVRLDLHVTPTGGSRLLAPVLGRMLRRSLRADARRLRDLLEADRARRPRETGDQAMRSAVST